MKCSIYMHFHHRILLIFHFAREKRIFVCFKSRVIGFDQILVKSHSMIVVSHHQNKAFYQITEENDENTTTSLVNP